MAKRSGEEINLLSVSFIDLLFGAMGAFIFLFIVIPKVTVEDMQTLKSVKDIKQNLTSMDSLLANLKNTVPTEDYENLLNVSAGLRASVKELDNELMDVRKKYSLLVANHKNLGNKYDALIIDRNALKGENEYLKDQIKKLKPENYVPPPKKKVEDGPAINRNKDTIVSKDDLYRRDSALIANERNKSDSAPEAIIGINFPFIVAIEWDDKKDKVHLYMRKKGTSNWCFYQTKRQRSTFGTWDKSLKKISPFPFEAIIQKDEIIPGEYEVFAQPYEASSGQVEVKGYIAMKAGQDPVKRKNFKPKVISVGKSPTSGNITDNFLGTVVVTTDNFNWIPAY